MFVMRIVFTLRSLLVPQRNHWIDTQRATRRDVTGEHRNESEHNCHCGER
jgi:hypothetical protein